MPSSPQRTSDQKGKSGLQKSRRTRSGTHQPSTTADQPGTPDVQAAALNPRQASPAQLLQIQRLYGNRAVQRLLSAAAPAAGPKLQDQNPQTVSRANLPGSLQGGPLDPQSQTQIESARGGGSPLDASVGAQVGGALGADFSAVKVHTGANADALNRSLSARAFTTGSDIFFSRGAYQPESSSGKQLLAHELTHVVQQGSAKPNKAGPEHDLRVQTKPALSAPDGARRAAKPNRASAEQGRKVQFKLSVGAANDRYEQEADRVAAQVMRAPELSAPIARRADESAEPKLARQVQRAPKFMADAAKTMGKFFKTKQAAEKLDHAGNYINPNYEQEVDADENRADGKQEAKKYSSVAGKGVGKFNATTSNEELALVEQKKIAERAQGKNVVHQNSTDLGFLYAQAEMLKEVYEAKCQEIAGKTRGKLSKRPGDGLKGMDRTLEKMNADYGGDASRMADLTGASIAFDNPEDLIACHKLIATDNLFKITKLKNSLANAYSYGDINMVVAMGESAGNIPIKIQKEVNGQMVSETIWEPYRGLQIELQLHLQPILTQKKAGHKQYEHQRAIEAKPIYAKTKKEKFLETPNLLPDDKQRWEQLRDEMVAIYGIGWKSILDQSEFSLDPNRQEKFKQKMLAAIPPVG